MGEQRRIGGAGAGRTLADDLVDENALLRASLGEMRDQLSAMRGDTDRDTLTPLPNARRFHDELGRVIAQARRHGTPAAMLHVDVQGLEGIAIRYGGPARDAALIHVANQLNALIRATDVAARVGDASFGLLLDHLDHNSAIDTAERIQRCVEQARVELGGAPVRLRVVIGVAAIDGAEEADAVAARAAGNAAAAADLI